MQRTLYQTTSKLRQLSRSGCIKSARKLFDEMPNRDTVAWNSMITAYSHMGDYQEAFHLFNQMRAGNVSPDDYTLTATLNACAGSSSPRNGTKIHALVIVLGYHASLPVNNSLIDMYGKCSNPSDASKVFAEMGETNEVTWCSLLFAHTNSGQFHAAREVFNLMPKKINIAWNILIAGLGQYGDIESCLHVFKDMQESECEPDQWTYSSLMSSCTESSELLYGSMMHATIIKRGWSSATEARNSILSFYAKIGSLDDALKTLESDGILTIVSQNAIIDAYMKAGDTHKALAEFQLVPEKNFISWTSMITGYARNGYGEAAISFFVEMMRNCLCPDHFTFGSVLDACSSLAAINIGRMVHGCVIHYGFSAYVYVGNCLINMYAKCGDLDGSVLVFDEMYEKDFVSLNAMLFALGLHGKASQAFKLYEDMMASGMKPDKVTFTGLLLTCCHSGLIDKALELFESMRSDHGLPVDTDHVACMVDILGRAGHFAEAKQFIKSYSKTTAKVTTYEALFRACCAQGEVGVGTSVAETLMVLEPHKESSYVLQSNLYCASGRWKEAETVRKTMVEEGLKKLPGCSWIGVGDKFTAFVSGNHSNLMVEELSRVLHSLQFEMMNPCNVCFRTLSNSDIHLNLII